MNVSCFIASSSEYLQKRSRFIFLDASSENILEMYRREQSNTTAKLHIWRLLAGIIIYEIHRKFKVIFPIHDIYRPTIVSFLWLIHLVTMLRSSLVIEYSKRCHWWLPRVVLKRTSYPFSSKWTLVYLYIHTLLIGCMCTVLFILCRPDIHL